MSVDHYGIHIGTFLYLRFYGIILMTGAVAAAYLATREVRRRGKDPELVWDGLIWVLIGGIIGARIWHILTPPPSMIAQGITTYFYLTHPLDAIAIWHGGLGIYGGVIGGAIALYFFTRSRKLNFLEWGDIAAPAVALGQAIGRWGNFVNQELYGKPTNLPWAVYIDPQNRLAAYQNVPTYHPLFLYESLWNLANMFLLLWLGRRYAARLKNGDLLLIYAIGYSIGRFLLEFLRLDSSYLWNINANQYLALGILVVAAVILYLRHRSDTETISEPQETPIKSE